MSDQKPYLCPVCKGRQVISNEFYVGRSKTRAEEWQSLQRGFVVRAQASNMKLEGIGMHGLKSDETLPPDLTDEEKEEARILHSEVPCRTCDGKGMVIV